MLLIDLTVVLTCGEPLNLPRNSLKLLYRRLDFHALCRSRRAGFREELPPRFALYSVLFPFVLPAYGIANESLEIVRPANVSYKCAQYRAAKELSTRSDFAALS